MLGDYQSIEKTCDNKQLISYCEKILGYLNEERKNSDSKFTDFVLVLDDDEEINCHKNILAAASPFFRTFFETKVDIVDRNKCDLRDFNPEAVKNCIDYCYEGKINSLQFSSDCDNFEWISDLLQIASYLQMNDLKETITDHLLKDVLNSDNSLTLYSIAEMFDLPQVVEQALRVIRLNGSLMLSHQDFVRLDKTSVIKIISFDNLSVSAEEEILEAVLKWCREKPERLSTIPELRKFIRIDTVNGIPLEDYMTKCLNGKSERTRRRILHQLGHRKENHGINMFLIFGKDNPGYFINTISGKKIELKDSVSTLLQDLSDSYHSHLYADGNFYVACCISKDDILLWNCDAVPERCIAIKVTKINFLSETLDGSRLSPRTFSEVSDWERGLTFMLNSNMYFFDGSITQSSFLKFDVNTTLWSRISLKWISKASHPGITCFDSIVYVFGGRKVTENLNSCFKYDIARGDIGFSSPTEIAKMQHACYSPAICSIENEIYLVGGKQLKKGTEQFNIVQVQFVQVFNITTESWRQLERLPRKLSNIVASVDYSYLCACGMDNSYNLIVYRMGLGGQELEWRELLRTNYTNDTIITSLRFNNDLLTESHKHKSKKKCTRWQRQSSLDYITFPSNFQNDQYTMM